MVPVKADHLSRTSIARRLQQPTRDFRRLRVRGAGRASSPIWPCSEWGLPCRRCYQRTRWSLTPPFHPCLRTNREIGPSAVCSLWHCPSPCDARPLAGTLPCGARTFLESLCQALRLAIHTRSPSTSDTCTYVDTKCPARHAPGCLSNIWLSAPVRTRT